jgi:hypothetical protein
MISIKKLDEISLLYNHSIKILSKPRWRFKGIVGIMIKPNIPRVIKGSITKRLEGHIIYR